MKKRGFIIRTLRWCALLSIFGFMLFSTAAYYYMQTHLPNVAHLKEAPLQVPLRVYTVDKKLIAEYGNLRRTPISLSGVPQDLINAVLATEDHRFYDHSGVDPIGLVRAAVQLMRDRSMTQGGSTITMQVARNFYLTRKKTFKRKIKEILLAIKIDRNLSKERILELYLNKIYFGHHAYGVAAAAKVYYGKPLSQLTLAQMAMIAGLPKAPSALNPISNPKGALERRNHVLERMYKHNFISAEQYHNAEQEPISAQYHGQRVEVNAPYVAEMARSALVAWVGKDAAYNGGYQIYTTIDSRLQKVANNAVNKGLLSYEERHRYRGPVKNLGAIDAPIQHWLESLQSIPKVQQLLPAVVVEVSKSEVGVLFANGQLVQLDEDSFSWALPQSIRSNYKVRKPQISKILKEGDVIYLRQLSNKSWQLAQKPEIEGTIVSLDPNNGAVKALVGGFDFYDSKFNRALQAKRQSGSAFKPFIYAAALAKGFTLASTINDAPVVIRDPGTAELWRPQNSTRRFYGPTRLRVGLIKSRNLVSIRLLQSVGLSYAVRYSENFGFNLKELPHSLSLALGTGLTTPLQIARGYAVFANGGYLVTPHFIKYISNPQNRIIFQAKPPTVPDKKIPNKTKQDAKNLATKADIDLPPEAKQTISPQVAYLITIALQDVIKLGTGRRALIMKRDDIAGKTGSTNDQKDAWFVGYNSHLVTTAWVGYDQPKSLHEYGAQAALPIWIDFMKEALKPLPDIPWKQPKDIVTLRIDPRSGQATTSQQKDSIFEIFRTQYAPNIQHAEYDNSDSNIDNDDEVYEHLF